MAEHIERIGKRIRERRKERDLTQTQLARLLNGNVDAAQVSRWERGIHEPSADRKEDLARALDVTVAYFMADQPADATPDLVATLNGDMPEDLRDLLIQIDGKLDRVLAAIAPAGNDSQHDGDELPTEPPIPPTPEPTAPTADEPPTEEEERRRQAE
jgi:transcriptional regulator with XRE-family HTH domain